MSEDSTSTSSEFTVANLVNPRKHFRPEVVAAVKAYRSTKPWQGTSKERKAKMLDFHAAMCAAYGLEIDLRFVGSFSGECEMGDGAFMTVAGRKRIVLVRRISVVTYLHCFTRARGAGRREAFVWSLSLFARFFKLSFSRRRQVGPFLLY